MSLAVQDKSSSIQEGKAKRTGANQIFLILVMLYLLVPLGATLVFGLSNDKGTSIDFSTYRQIFTDSRPLPEDPQPAWNGYSSGHWEGDRLVVETIGFRDDQWLDARGNPLTDAAKVTERFRRANFGTLEIEVTVNDPKAYTRPWTVMIRQTAVLDTEMLDSVCLENEKDVPHLPGR